MKRDGLVIILRGKVGSGKTDVADYIKENLGGKTKISTTDDVRRDKIPKNSETYSEENRLKVYLEIGERINNRLSYGDGENQIVDATCEKRGYLEAITENLPAGTIYSLIEIICEEGIVLLRIEEREKKKNSLSEAGVKQYFKVKEKYEKINPDYTIDNSNGVEKTKEQINEILKEIMS